MWHWRGECSLCASSAFRQRAAAVLLQTSRFSLFPFFLARGGGDLSRSQLRATFFPRCSDLFFKEKKNLGLAGCLGNLPPAAVAFPSARLSPNLDGSCCFSCFPPNLHLSEGGQGMEGLLQHSPCQHPGRGLGLRHPRGKTRPVCSFVCLCLEGLHGSFPSKNNEIWD